MGSCEGLDQRVKPELDKSKNWWKVNMNDVEKGDIIYEKGTQIVVMSDPECNINAHGEQWSFQGLTASGLGSFLTTVDSPYKLDLSWEPTLTPMIRIDGSIENLGDK